MRNRTNPADALRDVGSVQGIAVDEDVLETAEHRPAGLGIHDLLSAADRIHGDLDFEMSFKPCNWIKTHYDLSRHG
jgi:hypothetical protein